MKFTNKEMVELVVRRLGYRTNAGFLETKFVINEFSLAEILAEFSEEIAELKEKLNHQ